MGDIGGNSYLGFCGALFGPDGHHVLSHGANGSFHLWKNVSNDEGELPVIISCTCHSLQSIDDNHWEPQVSISGHFKAVESVTWDPNSRFLLSAR